MLIRSLKQLPAKATMFLARLEGVSKQFFARDRKKKNRKTGGYLTVFLALSLPIILSLIFVLLDGARRNAVRLQAEFAADTAVNSVMAEFNKELLSQYDLLMIDTTYGTGEISAENTCQHLQRYFEKNLSSGGIQGIKRADFTRTSLTSVRISQTRFALDDGCGVLREQVNAYLSAEPIGNLTSSLLENVSGYNGFGFDLTEWSRRKSQNEQEIQRGLEEARHRREAIGETEEDTEAIRKSEEAKQTALDSDIDEEHAADPWKEINAAWQTPVLKLALGGDGSISSEAVSTGELLSSRSWYTGSGYVTENSHHYTQADAVGMNVYIAEKCGNYQHPLEKGKLCYQMEYLLHGRESDRENLEKTAETLLLIRLAANTMFVMNDTAKRNEARAWGIILSLLCFNPELEEAFTNALLLGWSFAESVNDLRTLFAGGKVPLMKSSDSWKTSLLSIFKPGFWQESGGKGGSGLDYTGYLRMLLFLENGDTRDYRLMDVMEMDIRKAEGSNSFRMDGCMDSFLMEAVVSSAFGYSYQIQREGGYE